MKTENKGSRNELRKTLKADLDRFGSKKPNLKDWLLQNECWFVYRFIKQLRLVEFYQNKGMIYRPLFFWHFLIFKRLSFKLHITVYPNTVGPGFRIYHVGDFTHIGRNVKIGKNCTLLPGVVFGNKTEEEDDRPVTVGDDCFFGLGARILGPVHIGNNVTVGANAVVTKDIPDNAIVGGIPAKILKIKNYE